MGVCVNFWKNWNILMFFIFDNNILFKNYVFNFKVYLYDGYFVDLLISFFIYWNICFNINKENMILKNYINGYNS